MPKPIRIAPVAPPAPEIDRAHLAERIPVIRILAEACLRSVVASGVQRAQGLAVSAALTERADALQVLLELGADDRDFVPYLSGLDLLELDARSLATDPHGVQRQADMLATGRENVTALGVTSAEAAQ